MQIDAANRQATLSVGAFASFTPYATPGFGGVAALWRAQLGTAWHQRIQADSAAAGEGMRDEAPVSGALAWRGWTLHLTGRIDQLKTTQSPAPKIHLREIKTITEPLPLSRETLLERYLSYPIQLLAYRELLLRNLPSTHNPEPTTPRHAVPSRRSYQAEAEALAKAETPRTQHPIGAADYHLELLFVEIGSGLTQSLVLDSSYDTLLVDQLDAFVDYLDAKQERLANLRSLSVQPAYPSPRPGQETIQDDLAAAFAASPITLLQAPTGYGKTGVAWEYAARRLASGQSDRVLYLTSKTTGQTEALQRLRALLAATPQSQIPNPKSQTPTASFWHIRNKQEHCIHTEFRCSRQTCPYLADLHEKWKRGGLQRLYSLSHDEVPLDTLHAEGRATGICPYEIMRAGLGYRDIWIGDYNYLFSPNSARLLDDQADFEPARTFLIIDEAHNLPSRVAAAFSLEITVHQAYSAADDLHRVHAARRIQNHLKSLAQLVNELPAPNSRNASASPNAPLSLFHEEDFHDHLIQIADTLASEPLPYEELSPETCDFLFQLTAARAGQKRGELQHQLWSPSEGVARLECIDASAYIASQLARYNGILALSATFGPLDSYLEEIGLPHATPITRRPVPQPPEPSTQYPAPATQPPTQSKAPNSEKNLPSEGHLLGASRPDKNPTQTPLSRRPVTPELSSGGGSLGEGGTTQHRSTISHLTPPAPWRDHAYDVAIDLRVDTRYKTRRAHLATTAATIADAAQRAAPAIVFFPSYAYAQQALEALQIQHPFVRAALQPRAVGSLAERAAYLEEALAFNDALFLILGSSYAEGVDTLGGKAGVAIVVSPALPEMNAVQEAKRRRYEAQGRNGFERAYLQPGIQKVNQALGRLVRSPEHRVKALLHCQRFGDPKTRQLLDPLYQSRTYLHSDSDLSAWLDREIR